MSERAIPILACRNLDEVLEFYEALGFLKTFRQERPNPYLCLNRGDLDIHFAAVGGYEPENSLGSIIILTPDSGELFDHFAAGLKKHYGKLPVSGIPRITRPRRKQGTAGGFTVVDPGGNWLRISASTADPDTATTGALERVLLNAARQSDARGDVTQAIKVLDTGLLRHREASAVERAPVLVYLAELLVRDGNLERAGTVLSELKNLGLTETEKATLSDELAAATELANNL